MPSRADVGLAALRAGVSGKVVRLWEHPNKESNNDTRKLRIHSNISEDPHLLRYSDTCIGFKQPLVSRVCLSLYNPIVVRCPLMFQMSAARSDRIRDQLTMKSSVLNEDF